MGSESRTVMTSTGFPDLLTSRVHAVFGTAPVAEYVEPANQFVRSLETSTRCVKLLATKDRLNVIAKKFVPLSEARVTCGTLFVFQCRSNSRKASGALVA